MMSDLNNRKEQKSASNSTSSSSSTSECFYCYDDSDCVSCECCLHFVCAEHTAQDGKRCLECAHENCVRCHNRSQYACEECQHRVCSDHTSDNGKRCLRCAHEDCFFCDESANHLCYQCIHRVCLEHLVDNRIPDVCVFCFVKNQSTASSTSSSSSSSSSHKCCLNCAKKDCSFCDGKLLLFLPPQCRFCYESSHHVCVACSVVICSRHLASDGKNCVYCAKQDCCWCHDRASCECTECHQRICSKHMTSDEKQCLECTKQDRWMASSSSSILSSSSSSSSSSHAKVECRWCTHPMMDSCHKCHSPLCVSHRIWNNHNDSYCAECILNEEEKEENDGENIVNEDENVSSSSACAFCTNPSFHECTTCYALVCIDHISTYCPSCVVCADQICSFCSVRAIQRCVLCSRQMCLTHYGYGGHCCNCVSVSSSSLSTSSSSTNLIHVPLPCKEETKSTSESHSRGICCICSDCLPNRICYPCGHACLCSRCAVTLAKTSPVRCPICRKTIEQIGEFFLP